jgi:biotin carboxylase
MEEQKTLMLLGGSYSQIIAIKKANDLGYRTVLCDYLLDNPGQEYADVYYPVSTTDKEAVLRIAKEEKIHGIVAYSSDPAAPTAAYVANELDLPGMDYEIVRHFCEKHLFRDFLKNNHFNVPKSIQIDANNIKNIDTAGMRYPLIVKPTDSSGSKGVSVIHSSYELQKAIEDAALYSRNNVLIIEEYIIRDHPNVIEAELIVQNGLVVSWGLINSIRDNGSNPLLPAAYSYPLDLPKARIEIVKKEVQRLVDASRCINAAFNIEMIIDKYNNLYFLDAGPRNGGNMLPEYINMISGNDTIEATIRFAMGDCDSIDCRLDVDNGTQYGLIVLHSGHDGIFQRVEYSSELQDSVIREEIDVKPGDSIRTFTKCTDLIGLTFAKFNSHESMNSIMYALGDHVHIIGSEL